MCSSQGVEGLDWSPATNSILAVDIYSLFLWESGSLLPSRFRYTSDALSRDIQLFWSEDSRLISIAHNGFNQWDITTGESITSIEAASRKDFLSPTGDRKVSLELPTGSTDLFRMESMRLLNVDSGVEIGVLAERKSSRYQWYEMTWSNDGRYVAVCPGDTSIVTIPDARNGQLVSRVIPPEADEPIIRSIAFSPDGKRIAVGNLGHLVVAEVESAKEIFSIDAFPFSLTWTSNGRYLVVGSPSKITLLDEDGSSVKTIYRGGYNTKAMAINPSATIIAALTDIVGVPELYDVATGRHILSFHGIEGVTLSWSPDGDSLAVACKDGCVEILRAPAQKVLSH